jgi:hypothetical protein
MILSLPQPREAAVNSAGESETFKAAQDLAYTNGEDGSSNAKVLMIPHSS